MAQTKDTKPSIAEIWHNLAEKPFMAVGLFDRPGLRFVVVSSVTAGILYLTRTPETQQTALSSKFGGIRSDWIIVSLLMGTLSVLFI